MSNSMMVWAGCSIRTRYLGPTNFRGPRIKVTVAGGTETVTVPWDHAIDSGENHERAARKLMVDVLGWGNCPLIGASFDDKGYVFARRFTLSEIGR